MPSPVTPRPLSLSSAGFRDLLRFPDLLRFADLLLVRTDREFRNGGAPRPLPPWEGSGFGRSGASSSSGTETCCPIRGAGRTGIRHGREPRVVRLASVRPALRLRFRACERSRSSRPGPC